MLSCLLLALAPRPEPIRPCHDLFEFGQLRHVQLLQPRGEIVRFATQIELGTIEGWAEGEDTCIAIFEGESTRPLAELAVGTSLIRDFTWTERPAWYLIELQKRTTLAVVEPARSPRRGRSTGSRLRLISFPGGDELFSVGGVQEIEDTLVGEDRFDLVLRRGGCVVWLQSSGTVESVSVVTIDLGLDTVACAAFVRGEGGEAIRAWAVGWKGQDVFAVPFGQNGAGAPRSFRSDSPRGSSSDNPHVGEPSRATAWTSDSTSHLAVSWPSYDHWLGKLEMIDVSAEPRILWEGKPNPEAQDDTVASEYGQAIAFVPDVNEDGVPDILVTGPSGSCDTKIDLLSGQTGSIVKSWSPGNCMSTGHSLSLSGDSRRFLVGGTRWRGYPEAPTEEGRAYLIDVLRMEKLQSWKMSPRER
jgi:hypothetical protein